MGTTDLDDAPNLRTEYTRGFGEGLAYAVELADRSECVWSCRRRLVRAIKIAGEVGLDIDLDGELFMDELRCRVDDVTRSDEELRARRRSRATVW